MKNKVAFIHTTMNTPVPLKEAFYKRYPEDELITIVDDSLLSEFIGNGNEITKGIITRLVSYATNAKAQGAKVVICMCTTITKAVQIAAQVVDIPFVTIDTPMIKEAVHGGKNVALLVTAATTINASTAFATSCAKSEGTDAVIDTILVNGAFEALNVEKDKAKHDSLIAKCAEEAAKTHDIVVLAQVSMVDAKALVSCDKEVLTSLASGIEQIKNYF